MPPELTTAIIQWGPLAAIIAWGLWFFQNSVWPTFTGHLNKLHEMIDSLKAMAGNTEETKTLVQENNEIGKELLARIPARVEEHR